MVSTIHETVDDDTHDRLSAWKDELDLTWRQFFDHLANKELPEYVEVEDD